MILRLVLFLLALTLSFPPCQGQEDTLFRIVPQYNESTLREIALQAKPPEEEGDFLSPNLVELSTMIENLHYDIKYAGRDNFMGMRFYESPKAFLQKPAADALLKAAREFKKFGLGLVVYDAYRPWFVTKMFWEATHDSLKQFVANPSNGSRHNRGCAIDIGLYDLSTGKPVEMSSGYDEFTERAYADYEGATKEQKRNRDLLIRIMQENHFTVYRYEWWHFDFVDWKKYPIMNVRFEELEN